jgi:hypothetical protein
MNNNNMMKVQTMLSFLLTGFLLQKSSHAFLTTTTMNQSTLLSLKNPADRPFKRCSIRQSKQPIGLLQLSSSPDSNDSVDGPKDQPEIRFSRNASSETSSSIIGGGDDETTRSSTAVAAATNTVNERLMAELKEAEQKERYGARSAAGKKMRLVDGFGRRRKTDEEMKAAIAEARDLNGVNPIVAVLGSLFAFGVAAVLWISTNKLGTWFALHPPETDVYFVLRTAQVFRNVVMGLISLASGFFGVTGLGIFLLGVRVGYGVITGELDPTPIKKPTTPGKQEDDPSVDFSNVWDLMMNKKPGRRGGGKGKNDNDLFGI